VTFNEVTSAFRASFSLNSLVCSQQGALGELPHEEIVSFNLDLVSFVMEDFPADKPGTDGKACEYNSLTEGKGSVIVIST
jgi:hypothetical protein